jgi:hypothetical protein
VLGSRSCDWSNRALRCQLRKSPCLRDESGRAVLIHKFRPFKAMAVCKNPDEGTTPEFFERQTGECLGSRSVFPAIASMKRVVGLLNILRSHQ